MKSFGFTYVGEIYKNKLDNLFNIHKELISELIKQKSNIHLINLSFKSKCSIKMRTTNYTFRNKIKCQLIQFYCENTFIEFCKKKKLILILWIPDDNIKTFKYWATLKKTNTKLVTVNEVNRAFSDEELKIQPKKNINFFIRKLYRILVLLKFFPKIDFALSSSKKETLKKKFNILLKTKSYIFNNIKNELPVKNKFYYNTYKNSKKYIILLDTALFDHPLVANEIKLNRKSFFIKLRNKLKFMEKHFNKKVIICAHPKNDKKKVYEDFAGFQVRFNQTEKYSTQAFIVLFFTSSTFWYPIISDKPIILLKDFKLPKLWTIRTAEYKKILNFVTFDINDRLNVKKLNNLYMNSLKKIKKYKKIQEKNLSYKNELASNVLINLN